MPVKTNIQSFIFSISLIIGGGVFIFSGNVAKAAVDPYINFQGKVTNTDGTNVANTGYTFLFCLYTTATPATPCTAGANNDAIWRESKSITTTDGIFQTNLGSATALPSATTFNTAGLFLGINFNANGQMTPLVEFTSAPYAFNAEKLQGGDWATPGAIGTTTAAAGIFTNLSTTTGGLSIAAGQSYGGVGAVTLSSTTNGLTLDSGNNTLTVAATDTSITASGVTTLTLGANTRITNASGNINIEAAGTGTGNVQIGDGGTASATPDLLVLDTGSAEPSGTVGAMYYSTALTKFRCFQGAAWTDCIGTSGGSQTPWAQDISAAGFDLGSLSNLSFGETTGAPTGTDVGFFRDNTGDLTSNVLTGKTLNLAVNGIDEYNFSSTGLAFNSNNITGLGANLTAAGALTIASATSSALTINSGNGGAINIGDDTSAETISIGAGAAAKTLTMGSTNTTSTTTIQSGTGGIKLQGNGGTIVNPNVIQIGTGGAGTTTPNVLALDIKTLTGDPTVANTPNGSMYYNAGDNKFRCLENGVWANCIGTGGGGGGTPGGSSTQIQYNDGAGGFGANAGLTFNSGTQTLGLAGTSATLDLSGTDSKIVLTGITSEANVGVPAAGDLDIYSKSIAGRMMPKWKAPSGVDTPFQAALFQNAIYTWTPSTATAGLWTGTAGRTPAGTYSTLLPSATNFYTMMKRGNWVNVATTANQMVGPGSSEALFQRGGSAGQGGFFYVARFGLSAFTAGSRMFVGLSSSATTLTGQPSAALNMVGFGLDASETALTFMHNDGTSTATKDVIAGQPALAANQGFDAYIYAKPNDTTIYWRLDNSSTEVTIASGSITTDLPVATTNMYAQAVAGNAALTGASSVGIGVSRIYVETDR